VSRLDDLIKQVCPDGVPIMALGDIGTIQRGKRFVKSDVVSDGVPCIHYGEIYTKYGVSAAESYSFLRPEQATKLRSAHHGDVIIASAGETVEDIGKAVAWLGQQDVVIHDACYAFRSSLDPQYVAYFLRTDNFRNQARPLISSSKISSISTENFAKVRIPVPPIQVQHEIVRILDSFASLEAELETQLDAELAARRHQHTFYRNAILHGKEQENAMVRLDRVTDILVGFAFKSAQFSEGTQDTRLIRGDNLGQGELKHRTFKRWKRRTDDGLEYYELRAGDVVLAMDRPWIPAGLKWARITDDVLPALLVQRVARLRADDEVLDQRFLGWVISSPAFTEHVLRVQTGNTVPHISGSQIGSFQFELPALTEQVRLSAALDQLDELVSELSLGISCECSARRKQYEYYREKLVSFEEAVA
jgi:type I restriction enzyme, S subunit